MGQIGMTVFTEKRYPASQRTVILQFDSVEAAEAWDRAGQPLWPLLDAASQNEQHQGDDRQDDQDGPEHVALVPVKRRGKPRIRIG